MAEKKSIVELAAVAIEFCTALENASTMTRKAFVEKTHKLLSLLYMKAAVLATDDEIDDYCEHFVTERDWEHIRQKAEAKLGDLDNRVELIEPDSYTSHDRVETYLSECLADVYQDARNFVELCKDANDDSLQSAAADLILNFKLYWGVRALAILTEFHCLLYASDSNIDEENE